jgi:tight adherence protein C
VTIAVLAFVCVFLLIASAGMLLFYRQSMLKRISTVVSQTQRATFSQTLRGAGTSIGSMVKQFERVVPKSQAETSVAQQRLIRAGYRKDSALSFLYGAKVAVPLLLCIIVFFTGIGKGNPLFMYIAAAGLGYLAPDFWLGRKIKNRQKDVRLALPDVLDMLVICVEAGLGLDQATSRTAQELETAHPALCDELNIVVLEQAAGRARSDAWKHLAERVDVPSVRSLVSTLIQAEQYGTSVAKTLRTHSESLRTQRIQQVEEQAAKTTVKLIFPLVLFIFPCLFLVTLGPAAIVMADAFKNFFHQ